MPTWWIINGRPTCLHTSNDLLCNTQSHGLSPCFGFLAHVCVVLLGSMPLLPPAKAWTMHTSQSTSIAAHQHVFSVNDMQPSHGLGVAQHLHVLPSHHLSPINAFHLQSLPSASGVMAPAPTSAPTSAQFYYPSPSITSHSPTISIPSMGPSPSLSALGLPCGPGQSYHPGQTASEPHSARLLHPYWSANSPQGMSMQVSPAELQGIGLMMPQPVALQAVPGFMMQGETGGHEPTRGVKKTRKRKNVTTSEPVKESGRGRKRQKNTQAAGTVITAAPSVAEETQQVDGSMAPAAETTRGPGMQGPQTAAVCGVGPPVEPSPATALEGAHPLLPISSHYRNSRANATDVWYFLWPIQSREQPENMPENVPHCKIRPNAPFVACRLCG